MREILPIFFSEQSIQIYDLSAFFIDLVGLILLVMQSAFFFGILPGGIVGLIDVLAVWPITRNSSEIEAWDSFSWSTQKARRTFNDWWIGGATIGCVCGLIYSAFDIPSRLLGSGRDAVLNQPPLTDFGSGLFLGIFAGIAVSLTQQVLASVLMRKGHNSIEEKRKHIIRRIFFFLLPYIILCPLFGIILLVSHGSPKLIAAGLMLAVAVSVIAGILLGLLLGTIFGLMNGVKGGDIQKTALPNQGIRKSMKNALLFGLGTGILAALAFAVFIINTREDSIINNILIGVGLSVFLVAPIGGLFLGGMACVKHFTLRVMLFRQGKMPWNYRRFLDYAAERLFLQKVGGGYVFVHRMLLEHFSEMPKHLSKN